MRKLQLAGLGALAFALSSGAIGAPKSDQAFLTDAIQGDLAEVQMGKLAVSRGQSEGVKEFGITLADDHTKALEEAAELAKTKQIAIPTSPKPDAQKMYEMLSKLSGAEFDRQFVAHMIEGHQKEIATFSEQAKGSNESDVTGLAAKTLPTLQKHLQIAQSLQK